MFDHHQKIRHEIKSTDESKISKKLRGNTYVIFGQNMTFNFGCDKKQLNFQRRIN